MPEGSSAGNVKKPVNGSEHSSAHPAVVALHATLDEIARMIHGEEPTCDFVAARQEAIAMSGRSEGLRVSLAELSKHGGLRRRTRRHAVG
jgi:hypothetical protein